MVSPRSDGAGVRYGLGLGVMVLIFAVAESPSLLWQSPSKAVERF